MRRGRCFGLLFRRHADSRHHRFTPRQPNTAVLTAPYYDPGSHMADDDISALWDDLDPVPELEPRLQPCRFDPERPARGGVLVADLRPSFETFRAVRIDDLRNGTTYFTGPVPSPNSQPKLLPCTLPAASYHGELVSAAFQGKDIWLYGVPEDLDAVPDCANSDSGSSSGGLNRRNSGPSVRSVSRSQDSNEPPRVPQWQVLCDKLRNTFVEGSKVAELEGVHTLKWVGGFGNSPLKERLVVAARGITPEDRSQRTRVSTLWTVAGSRY